MVVVVVGTCLLVVLVLVLIFCASKNGRAVKIMNIWEAYVICMNLVKKRTIKVEKGTKLN